MLFSIYGIEVTLTHVLAGCALFLTIFQATATIRHQRMTVKPLIDSWHDITDNEIHFYVTNKGLGTAEIIGFSFLIGDQRLDRQSLCNAIQSVLSEFNYQSKIGELHTKNSYMAKDEKVDLLYITFKEEIDMDALERHLIKLVSLQIDYKSLYGQTFQFKTNEGSQTNMRIGAYQKLKSRFSKLKKCIF